MTEKAEKNKSGAGKFFLGAAIGAAVGAIASKFIKLEVDEGEDLPEEETCDCDKECKCAKKPSEKKITEEKTTAKKKTSEKK